MNKLKIFSGIILCAAIFLYGIALGKYKVFPYQLLITANEYIEYRFNSVDNEEITLEEGAEIISTSLQRLILQKIYIGEEFGRLGAMSNINNYLFIISQKGKIMIFDTEDFKQININIPNVPLNYDKLLLSGQTQNNFNTIYFRVSGAYVEKIEEDIYQLFVTHHFYNQERNCIEHRISKNEFSLSGSNSEFNLNSWQPLYIAEPCVEIKPENYSGNSPFHGHAGGGKIISYNDEYLLVSVGDYDNNGMNGSKSWAMDVNVPYGKILLVNKKNGEWRIFSLGHRNPLGLYMDSQGTVWSTENGPKGGDELNIIEQNKNYGWPEVSYGLWYIQAYASEIGRNYGHHSNYTAPEFSWTPAIAPNNLIRFEGEKFVDWNGDLLIGTMKSRSLHRLKLNEDHDVLIDEEISLGVRVRDLIMLENEKIAIITDNYTLLIIEDGGAAYEEIDNEALSAISYVNNNDITTNKNYQKMIFEQYCSGCHNTEPINGIGPHLHNILGRKIGELNDYNYSESLLNDDRIWTRKLLEDFLKNTNSEFEENNMPIINLKDDEIQQIVKYLSEK